MCHAVEAGEVRADRNATLTARSPLLESDRAKLGDAHDRISLSEQLVIRLGVSRLGGGPGRESLKEIPGSYQLPDRKRIGLVS